MAAIMTTTDQFTVARVGLGFARPGSDDAGSIKQKVHDGDTINVRSLGNFGVRFLGVDAPEVSFTIAPKRGVKTNFFLSLNNEKWIRYLEDPFAGAPEYKNSFSKDLMDHLESKLGPDTALNHYRHAEKAHRMLEQIIETDRNDLGKNNQDLEFIVVFAFEVMDRYGRMLGLIDTYIEDEKIRVGRPFYNLRLARMGLVNPYSIWPNIDPFRKNDRISEALFKPGERKGKVIKGELENLMRWTGDARKNQIGVYDKEDPLLLEPFEVRYLGNKELPRRWIIDLSKDDNVLYPPQEYHKIDRENRLFIDEEYVPFFESRGWVRQSSFFTV